MHSKVKHYALSPLNINSINVSISYETLGNTILNKYIIR